MHSTRYSENKNQEPKKRTLAYANPQATIQATDSKISHPRSTNHVATNSMVIATPPNGHTSRNDQVKHLESFILDDQLAQLRTRPANAAASLLPCKRQVKPVFIRVWPATAGAGAAAWMLPVRVRIEVILTGETTSAE